MRSVIAIVALACASLVAAAGCDGGECIESAPTVGAEIGLGDLETGYASMDDGADVPIVLGPQGLHMIVVSVRVDGLRTTPGDLHRVTVAVEHEGAVVAGTVGEVASAPAPGDSVADFLGLRVVFAIEEVRPLDGVAATVIATITDDCGEEIAAERGIRLRL